MYSRDTQLQMHGALLGLRVTHSCQGMGLFWGYGIKLLKADAND